MLGAVFLGMVAAVACWMQFRTDHFGPLAVASLILVGVWWLRPSYKWFCLALPLATLALLCVDAFVLRHRVAVRLRVWSPLGMESLEDTLPSPSGRTVVYIVGTHWLDSSYEAYISDGGLFPKRYYLATKSDDAFYPRDVSGQWKGDVFTAAEQFLALRYTESSGRLETFTH